MTKKRNLTTFMIAIMIMLFSLPVNAEGIKGYAQWDELNTTLTFYGGESVPDGAFALNTGGVAPKWSGNSSCTNVVFDESFKDAKPTSCYLWFEGFEQLKVIEGIEYLNTEKVTTMSHMFAGCKDLTSLDLSSFNTAKVEVMGFMFNGCSGLTTIYVSDDFTTSAGTSGLGMFEGCRQLKGAASYDPAKTGIDMANFDGYFTPINITPYVKWDASTKVLTFKVANTKEEGVYDLNEGANAPGWNIYDVKNNCTKVVFTPSFNHAKPTSCCSWFSGFSNLTTIEGIENLNTEKVTDMSYMFNNCTGLTSLNLSSFNTAEVTKMNNMFKDCSSLTSLDLSNFDTSNVTNMSYMFYNCRELTSLNLSGFNTANVTNMSYMFSDCPNLRSLTLSSFFNTANVTDMSSMFRGCSSLTSLDLSKFNTDKVENMSSMFNGCSDLENLTLSSFNTDKVTDMSAMFSSCQKLTSLDLSNFDTSNVTTMYQLFYDCSGLTSLDLSSFNTANVTNMNNMFYGCGGLTALDLSSFNTANVTDMSCMFCWCSRLTSLALSSFNTANVEYMSYMFYGCSGLNSLNLSSFKTANVTNMNYMFNGCSGLTKIYVSDDFATGNVTYGSNMFTGCSKLVGAIGYDSGKTSKEYANYNTGYFKTYFTLGEKKVELFGEQLTTESLDLSGDNDFVAHAPFTANTAKYSRVLSSSGSTWFSLCLPFAYTPNNFTAYQLNGATEKAVEIEEITETIAAGTPVLFKFKDGEKKEINITAPDANILKAPVDVPAVNGTDGSSLQLCGTYQTKSFSSEDNNAFILLNNKLMNPAKMYENTNVSKVSVNPFRAYMTLTASAQTSSARAFSIGHGGEGNEGTTAIDLLNSVATDDAEYYDINGRRIDAPAKGVNIVRRGNKTIKLIIK